MSTAAAAPGAREVAARAELTLPVVEVFGPTVQGEGPQAGEPAYFVRFGGCDFRCSWCDSWHAVDPTQVRTGERLSTRNIIRRIDELAAGPDLVVLTGGNPALLELGGLVAELRERAYRVAVETQGSRWRDWLGDVNTVVVSPKGPSSGMDTPAHRRALRAFLATAQGTGVDLALKVVVFDEGDLRYAEELAGQHDAVPLFLSVGTDVGLGEPETVHALLERLRWLCEVTARRSSLRRARVAPQLHVLAWGTRRGV
jgi:7-carboxy-7-deazaguanine synthase